MNALARSASRILPSARQPAASRWQKSVLCLKPARSSYRWQTGQAHLRHKTAMAATTQQDGGSRREMLKDQARRFLDTWYMAPSLQGNEEAEFSTGQVADQMRQLLAPDVVHQADGVSHTKDVKGIDGILEDLKHTHQKFQHLSYQPQLLAANEDDSLVFVALQYKRQDTTTAAKSMTAEQRTSSGLMLKKFHFNSDKKIDSILVCRQLTAAEIADKMKNIEACNPADLSHTAQLLASQQQVSQDDREKMKNAILKYVGAWDSATSTQQLADVLAPEARSLDGYGLHGRGKDFQNRQQAEAVVADVHAKYDNHNVLLGWAVADNARIGFEHWRADDQQGGAMTAGQGFMQGLDLLVFDEGNKIKEVVQFTMHPYPQMKHGSA